MSSLRVLGRSCSKTTGEERRHGAFCDRNSVNVVQGQAAGTPWYPNQWHQLLHIVSVAINVGRQTAVCFEGASGLSCEQWRRKQYLRTSICQPDSARSSSAITRSRSEEQ